MDFHTISFNEVLHNIREFRTTIDVSSNIVFFSTNVTIKMRAVTRHYTTNLRRVSKVVTHKIHLHDAERSLTVVVISVHLENTVFQNVNKIIL